MPTKLLLARRAGRLGQRIEPKSKSARLIGGLAALTAVLLSASTARLDASAGTAGSLSVALLPEVLPLAAPPARGLAGLPRNIDGLVVALARKYRVSAEATREMVDAAYVEGGRNGLDPLLIIAVIGVESRFNPIAQSDGGALGLMQIIPRYHYDKYDAEAESMLDPRVNIQVGAAVLREYIRRAGTEEAGLQLYNGANDDESNTYAHKVLAEKQRLKSLIRRGA
jgi:soluble lytic murein transglycosylase-like protein